MGTKQRIGRSTDKHFGRVFGRNATAQTMFSVARELEAAAYAKRFLNPTNLQADALSLLAVLADYWGIERVRLLGKTVNPSLAALIRPANA
jgi:hypothetical protein